MSTATPGSEAPRRKVKEIEVMVADTIQETPDTTTIVLFTGNDLLPYQPGHFLTIEPHQFDGLARWVNYLEDVKGKKEPPRAYSISSAPHEKYLAITVKEERYITGSTLYPPLLSPLLVRRLNKGMRMSVTGFTGPYVMPADIEKQTNHIVHLCAGSGVVPNMSIIKHALGTNMHLRHTVIYSSKTWADIIFRRQLDDLRQQYPDKLSVYYALTRENRGAPERPDVSLGRITTQLISRVVQDRSAAYFFACGPGVSKFDRAAAKKKGEEPQPRFLEGVLASLQELQISEDKIYYESYG